MKASFCILVCLLSLSLALLVGKGRAAAAEAVAADAAAPSLRVALFLDDSAGDVAYNQSLLQGLKSAQKKWGITATVIPSSDPARHEQDFLRVAKAGYDLLILPTIPFHTLLMNTAGNYPKTRFASVGAVVKAPNVLSFTFATAESAFLAGAAAALISQHLPAVPQPGEKDREPSAALIGWIGGQDIPQSRGYLTGYQQGAKTIDPHIRVKAVFCGTFSEPAAGKEAAQKLFAEGATVIMHAAGHAGLGLLEAAQEAWGQSSHKGPCVIDSGVLPPPQNPQEPLQKPQAPLALTTIRHADQAVLQAIAALHNKNFKASTQHLDLATGGVSIDEPQQLHQNLIHILRPSLGEQAANAAAQSIATQLANLTQALQQKKIKVDPGTTRGLCDCL